MAKPASAPGRPAVAVAIVTSHLGVLTDEEGAFMTRRWLAGRMLLKIVYLLTCRVLGVAVLVLRGDRAKAAELLVLRHENAVLRRHVGRVRYQPADRVWLAALARLIVRRRWMEIFPVTPATLLAGTASWPRLGTTRASGASPAVRRRSRHHTPCRSAGEGESAVGIPPDPRRAHEARPHSALITRYDKASRAASASRTSAPARSSACAR